MMPAHHDAGKERFFIGQRQMTDPARPRTQGEDAGRRGRKRFFAALLRKRFFFAAGARE
jgi:hypothetical protein